MNTANSPVADPTGKRKTGTFSRLRGKRRWWLLALVAFLAIQAGWLLRDRFGVRAVVYNEGPALIESVVLSCDGHEVTLGEIEAEDSRYEWFHVKHTTVVGLNWWASGVQHEAAWPAAPGEIVTLRVSGDGTVVTSLERSLLLKLQDMVAAE